MSEFRPNKDPETEFLRRRATCPEQLEDRIAFDAGRLVMSQIRHRKICRPFGQITRIHTIALQNAAGDLIQFIPAKVHGGRLRFQEIPVLTEVPAKLLAEPGVGPFNHCIDEDPAEALIGRRFENSR